MANRAPTYKQFDEDQLRDSIRVAWDRFRKVSKAGKKVPDATDEMLTTFIKLARQYEIARNAKAPSVIETLKHLETGEQLTRKFTRWIDKTLSGKLLALAGVDSSIGSVLAFGGKFSFSRENGISSGPGILKFKKELDEFGSYLSVLTNEHRMSKAKKKLPDKTRHSFLEDLAHSLMFFGIRPTKADRGFFVMLSKCLLSAAGDKRKEFKSDVQHAIDSALASEELRISNGMPPRI